ncbi:MAG: hypothetical protein K6A05_09015 [Lachnospiraceae bacterium]|nr:hypothetical protein [Lachnospiraceae bacterium]
MSEIDVITLGAARKYIDECMEKFKASNGGIVYGFHVDAMNSNPNNAVTYLKQAVGMVPSYMNFNAGEWYWGSWKDAFFMPRPCMLKYDGTVDYYLKEDNYGLKEDGTASDVSNVEYDGNAMMEWGREGQRIYYKLVNDKNGSGYSCYISDCQVDEDYKCYPFINNEGDLVDHFYTPIYDGSLDEAGRLRSISGTSDILSGSSGLTEIEAARKNNPAGENLWYTENMADSILINMLLVLITKSLDSQSKVGMGNVNGGSDSNHSYIMPGTMNDKGLFWGKNGSGGSTTANHFGVKVFGMENWWGNTWRRIAGLMVDKNAKVYYKLTWGTQDGSEIDGYPFNTPAGMIEAGVLPENLRTASNGFTSKTNAINNEFLLPVEAAGSSSTYYCDLIASNPWGNIYAARGGASNLGGLAGAFALTLVNAVTNASWTYGASVSCKPLAR